MNELIQKAYMFSKKKHINQLDDCGKNYFDTHIKQVFNIIIQIAPDDINLQCASLLHDTLEDTDTSIEELRKEFEDDITNLVLEVTHEGCADQHGYYFPRLKTQRGIILKFADRLSNLSRMDSWNSKRKAQYLRKSKFWKSE